MGITRNRVIAVAVGAIALPMLTACNENGEFQIAQRLNLGAADHISVEGASPKPGQVIERDVEAPDVFATIESGLWDGRPSLGGVWVAHPDVTEPERVIIRNQDNDKFVVGALFRRERAIPGPRLQISSDAAAALGMLAGSPSELDVVALVREEIVVEEQAPIAIEDVVAEAESAQTPVTEPAKEVAETQLDPIAVAAAIEAAPDKSEETAKPSETAEVADAAPEADVKPEDLARAEVAPEAAPKPRAQLPNFLTRIFGPKKAVEPEAGIEVAALEPADLPQSTLPATLPKSKNASSLGKPYLQVGIFSVEDNAKRTAKMMRDAGMIPTIRESVTGGKPFWRVIVGPASTSFERKSLLKTIKEVGFTDAYPVRG